MKKGISAVVSVQRASICLALAIAALVLPASSLFAVTCPVLKHDAPSDADKAFLAADFPKAEGLYKTALAAHPGDPALAAGLVHTLLREQKVSDAADAVKAALAAAPNSAQLMTLRGELEFRQGEPWSAEPTAIASYKLDPCNPRTRLLYARVAEVNSKYSTARQQIQLAHQFDPEDPEIRLAWIQTLPIAQRATELESYLSEPNSNDPGTVGMLKSVLARLKALASEPVHACKLGSATQTAEIDFIKLGVNATKVNRPLPSGMDLGLNSTSARLMVGAGEGGITLYRNAAERAGLKRLTPNEAPAFPGAKPSYLALAQTLKVGPLEFHDCALKVIDASSPFDDGEGILGIDVFSDFLLTADYPMRKIQLAPLPARPGDTAAPALHSNQYEDIGVAAPQPMDRFIAPEMKDYTQIYRSGRSLILPSAISDKMVKLFILDAGAPETNVSADVAKQVTKVNERNAPWGDAKWVIADEISFNFAHMSQKLANVRTADTSLNSRITGMDISGAIGANTFKLLIMHIDYRDGLVKFEYIPNHGNQLQ